MMNTAEYIASIAAGVSGVAALASWLALAITVHSNKFTLIRQAEADWDNVRRNYRENFWTTIENAYATFTRDGKMYRMR